MIQSTKYWYFDFLDFLIKFACVKNINGYTVEKL